MLSEEVKILDPATQVIWRCWCSRGIRRRRQTAWRRVTRRKCRRRETVETRITTCRKARRASLLTSPPKPTQKTLPRMATKARRWWSERQTGTNARNKFCRGWTIHRSNKNLNQHSHSHRTKLEQTESKKWACISTLSLCYESKAITKSNCMQSCLFTFNRFYLCWMT